MSTPPTSSEVTVQRPGTFAWKLSISEGNQIWVSQGDDRINLSAYTARLLARSLDAAALYIETVEP